MVCNKCGANLKDGDIYCPSCGAKVDIPAEPASPEQPAAPVVPAVPVQNTGVNFSVPEKKHVTLGGWILRYIINFIPCVGSVAFLVMLFVWSFDESYDDTSRNWAKAQLIMMAISVVVGLIAFFCLRQYFYDVNAIMQYNYYR